MAISAGPIFTINPSISLMVNFDPSQDTQAREHLDELWAKLSEGGETLIPVDSYPFSERYGWVKDKFGVSWQLILTNPTGEPRPFIIPSLMFSQAAQNKAGEAIDFYMSVFRSAKNGTRAVYATDTGPAKVGSLMFADFMLEGQWLAAMDSGAEQDFTFNEAVSLLINCDTQDEIDYYWEKLSAHPEAEQSGWLKDQYGVSWQVSSTALGKIMQEGSQEQIDRVVQAFLPMKKLDIAAIEAAYRGE